MPDRLSLEGRVAVVTGAGGGLGRAYALDLARRGASLVVNDLGTSTSGSGSESKPADRVVAEIQALGGTAVANGDSVATRSGGRRIVDTALDAFGRLDILISNAGILRNHPFAELTDDDIDLVMDVHLGGAFNLLRPAYAQMVQQQYGRVVLTSSGSGLFGHDDQANYSAAKAGIFGLMRGVAKEAAEQGILINSVLPIALTRMAEGREDTAKSLILGGGPESVAPLVSYLVSAENNVTGEAFSAFDGHYASVFTATTPGWNALPGTKPTAEDIAEHLSTIRDRQGYWSPTSVDEEMGSVTRQRHAATSPTS